MPRNLCVPTPRAQPCSLTVVKVAHVRVVEIGHRLGHGASGTRPRASAARRPTAPPPAVRAAQARSLPLRNRASDPPPEATPGPRPPAGVPPLASLGLSSFWGVNDPALAGKGYPGSWDARAISFQPGVKSWGSPAVPSSRLPQGGADRGHRSRKLRGSGHAAPLGCRKLAFPSRRGRLLASRSSGVPKGRSCAKSAE